jgi:hypothetical protein
MGFVEWKVRFGQMRGRLLRPTEIAGLAMTFEFG